jgi:hypothetical protein
VGYLVNDAECNFPEYFWYIEGASNIGG